MPRPSGTHVTTAAVRERLEEEIIMPTDTGIHIVTADAGFTRLVQPVVDKIDTSADSWSNGNFAHVLLDFPLTWALGQLNRMNSIERARTVVATQATHPAYLDMLAA